MRLRPGGEKELTDRSGESSGRKPSGDGGAQVKIVIPDDHSMVSLLGSRDELLHVIEKAFDADIHVRGNEITITGRARGERAGRRASSRSSPSCWRAAPS